MNTNARQDRTASARASDATPTGVPSVLDVLPSGFFSTCWRRRPVLVRGGLADAIPLVREDDIEAYEADYHRAPVTWRTGSIGRIGTISFIANAECINEPLAQLCAQFRSDFGWPHGEVALVRNREMGGSGPHFDNVDNFVTQTAGSKHWQLWPNDGVDPEERRLRLLRTPHYGEVAVPDDPTELIDVIVHPGDLLYVPLFWGHRARALGPGTSLSLALKALLPSQVLLRGLAARLRDLTDDCEPLPLPIGEDDVEGRTATLLANAFSVVARDLAPGEGPAGAERERASRVAAAGLAEIASNRHDALLTPRVSDEPIQLCEVMIPIRERLDREPLDLAVLACFPPSPDLARVVRWLELVHLHRFFGLVSLGPRRWWSSDVREPWARSRQHLESYDLDLLQHAAADPELIELTRQLRRHLQAFDKRHAIVTLGRWNARLETLASSRTGRTGSVAVVLDAECTLHGDADAVGLLGAALAVVDKTWPGFSDVFTEVVAFVAIVRSDHQARKATRRARVAAVGSEWPVEQVAEALVGELARVAVQVVERIGTRSPGCAPGYDGSWSADPAPVARVASMLAMARFLHDRGEIERAEHRRQIAEGLLSVIGESRSLTSLGRALVETLERCGGSPALPAIGVLGPVLDELEALDRAEASEFEQGLTMNMYRFRWSDVGRRPDDPVESFTPAASGMDCGLPPWLSR